MRQRSKNTPNTDRFFLKFLRASGGSDPSAALKLIELYYNHLEDGSKFLQHAKPSKVEKLLEQQTMAMLPHRDRHGRRVMCQFPGRWDPSQFS